MQQTEVRKLAAIMFTDMVGYTALMQTDEEDAAKRRQQHKLVFDNSVKEHNGKILQYFGDGTLSIFSSAIDSVNCAIDIGLHDDPRFEEVKKMMNL